MQSTGGSGTSHGGLAALPEMQFKLRNKSLEIVRYELSGE
jgi:hypothetical protein